MLSLAGQLTKPINTLRVQAIKELSLQPCVRCLSIAHAHSTQFQPRHRAVQQYYQERWFSNKPEKRIGFFGGLIEEVQKGFKKDEGFQDSIKKFRDEYKKLEESEALKKARAKFEAIEKESKPKDQIKQTFSSLKETVGKSTEELTKSEYVQKTKKIAEDIGKKAGQTTESIYKQTEAWSQTQTFQHVSKGVSVAKTEFENIAISKADIYQSPVQLFKRTDLATIKHDEKIIEADTESMGVVMHKDSRWQQSWQSFKDNNQFVHKMFDMKVKYDESDNIAIRLSRNVTDRLSGLFGNMFKPSELSAALTEITKMDPTFEREYFIRDCRHVFIPNILESVGRGKLDVLESWCYEAEFGRLSAPFKQAKEHGWSIHQRIIDVSHIDIVGGQVSENGPVLMITFVTQQVIYVTDSKGEVVEGKKDKVMRINHVWALCRDQSELDPRTAWKLMESHAHAQEVFM